MMAHRRLVMGLTAVALGALILVWLTTTYGLPTALMMMAGVLLLTVIGILWQSLQSLGGESSLTLEEAMTLAAPPAEEEQKRAVLRSLKDLEYERSVGKVGEADYAELSARYRDEARRWLQDLDTRYDPARQRAERDLEARLRAARGASEEAASSLGQAVGAQGGELGGAALEPDATIPGTPRASKKPKRPRPQPSKAEAGEGMLEASESSQATAASPETVTPTRKCEECGARNELRLDRCQQCDHPLCGSDERLCPACPARFGKSQDSCPSCGVTVQATG